MNKNAVFFYDFTSVCWDASSSGGVYITKRFLVSPGDLLIDLFTL